MSGNRRCEVCYSRTWVGDLMKKVLLTGASGFVGRQILRALSRFDVQVIPVLRSDKAPDFFNQDNISDVIYSPDIFKESETWWAEKCAGIHTLIHCAWYVEPGQYLESPKNIECLIGSLNIARGSVEAGVTRFVGIGTCFEYKLLEHVLSTDTPLDPKSPYAASKAALYTALSRWLPKESVEFVWCRLFYLFGEGEDDRRLAPLIHDRLAKGEIVELEDGECIRDYLDVAIAGDLIAEAALGVREGAVNICSGVPITIREFALNIAKIYGRPDLLRFDAGKVTNFNPSRVVGKK